MNGPGTKEREEAFMSRNESLPTVGETVCVTEPGIGADFTRARNLAREKARERCRYPMMLSWYEGATGRCHPSFSCGSGDRPPWVVYAEARGGNLTVVVNDGAYVFVYLVDEG
jgi:hypothetical protein